MRELQYPFDADWILQNRRKIKKSFLQKKTDYVSKKIAVLGGSTTHDIVQILELFLLNVGIAPSFYESEYGQYYQDAMFDNPKLDAFAPDIIFIHTTNRNIHVGYPSMQDTPEDIQERIDREMQYYIPVWENLAKRYSCAIIQNNFEFPFYRLLGNKDGTDCHGRVHFIQSLNRKFIEYANEHRDFYIHDIQYLSATYGLDRWSDPSYWYMYKYALSFSAIPVFAHSLANMIKSIFGKNKKAFALDLDNTLWGGVVGDDGVDGIEIGQETAMGQGYWEFQSYIKAHKELGVILNVCSKNDAANAVAGLSHPSGVLRPEDFMVMKANWDAKSENIAALASELNILPESIVFVDDNPAEREIVRSFLPEVAVPEVNRVDEYIHVLDRSGYFEITSFSQDDGKRNEMYQANIKRAQAQAAYTDYNAYLKSLEMRAEIRDFEPIYLSRITQLTNKSNQFNVTTRRYTESEMTAISQDAGYIRLYGRLTDRFGDNGIVSVVIGRIEDAFVHIDLWLMSCRVLKRDMEYAMLDSLVARCQSIGIESIFGYYYPTAKNQMVADLFERFGFTNVAADDAGNTVWKLNVSDYIKKNHVILVEE